jgi:hypothetical protein
MTRTEHDLIAMYDYQPDIDALEFRISQWILTSPGVSAGSRRSGGRSWVAATTAAVAVAAVAITGSVLAERGLQSHPTAIAAPPASARPDSSPGATSADASATVPLTAQVAQQTLLDLLPRKGTITKRTGAADEGSALTEMTFDDGHGAAQIDLAVSYPVNGLSKTGWACTPGTSVPPITGCSTLPDGTQLFRSQGYEYPDRRVDTLDWTVAALRPDGVQVEITEWNAPTEKDSPISRPAPPFTIAELTAVATSPVWTSTVSPSTVQRDAALFVPDDRLSPSVADPTANADQAKAAKSSGAGPR